MAKLDVREDPRFQRREWRMERIGWGAIGLIILGALSGLFGSGPASRAQAGEEGSPLWVEHARFERYQASSRLRIHAHPATGEDRLRIRINREFLRDVEISRIEPEPEIQELAQDGVILDFPVRGSSGPLEVTVHFQGTAFGSRRVVVALEGGPRVSFGIFFYP